MRMRIPNGYGSVVKFRGNRRQPYAVRTSEINEFINIKAPRIPPDDVQRDLKRLNCMPIVCLLQAQNNMCEHRFV